MNKTIAVIRGDGIGPEIVNEAMGVLDAVAEKQYLAFDVEPVFKPVVHWYCFSSLLVLLRVKVDVPCLVSWVMSSIQMVVYRKMSGYFTVSSLDMIATSFAEV